MFFSLLNGLIEDYSDHGAAKEHKNPFCNLVPRAFPAPSNIEEISHGNEVVLSGKIR